MNSINKNNIDDTQIHESTAELGDGYMTFGDHLEVLRRMLLRIFLAIIINSIIVFIFKEQVTDLLFAPTNSDFILYQWINDLLNIFNINSVQLDEFNIQLINTELSSQFMTHLQISFYFGSLISSPYIVYQLFGFIKPALFESEKKYFVLILFAIYVLFSIGLIMNYFIIFPISLRFLGTYQLNEAVANTVSLNSYTSSFLLLSLAMGLVFEFPAISFILGKMGIIDANTLKRYRKYAFVIILIVSALITPPDVFSLILMTIPLYVLYEFSIFILAYTVHNASGEDEEQENDVEKYTTN